jgi:23S rRNA pseudouridine1911/1915/1917 synthase
VVGDKIYGPDQSYFDRFSRRQLEKDAWEKLRLPRQALHAAAIRLPHPRTGQSLSFRSPLPADLQTFLEGS